MITSPPALLERLTLAGAPMPRTTSHSVWPSATVPVVEGTGAAAAPSVVAALASAGPPGGIIPGQNPSAVTRSSAATGLLGVRGADSIEMFLMNSRPGRENHTSSFDRRSDENILAALEQPAMSGVNPSSASSRFRYGL